MKRIFTLLVLLAVVVTGWAQVEIDGIAYNLNSEGKTAAVTSNSNTAYEGDIVIPASVTNEGVEYTVTSIEDGAFDSCSGLTSVDIPNSVTSIGINAFSGCSGLTSVDIPNSVTSIEWGAFEGCSGLTSVDIPNSVTIIGDCTFSGCSGLTSVTIPNSVTIIGNSAFGECSGLTSVTIPNSVTSIGSSAFQDCSGLTSVDIPNSVTNIEWGAFATCSGLTSVTIPNSVTSIGSFAFYGCSGLTSVDIPNSVTTIGSDAFEVCSGLTSVDIPNSVTSIEGYAFYGCSGLTSVDIPNSVTSIEEGTFQDCSGLTSVDIPNSVTSIGSYAFYGCSGLTSVTIPNSVTSIGYAAFYECYDLTSVTNLAETPQDIQDIEESFPFSDFCTLHVLPGCGDAYRAAEFWNYFSIIEDAVLPSDDIADDIALVDGQVFEHNSMETYLSLTYTRNFNNTEWQALYVPFAMEYSDWSDKADIYKLQNIFENDNDDNGTVDEWVLRVIKLTDGSSIKANTPYVIKPKAAGDMTLQTSLPVLYPAEEKNVWCASTDYSFYFTGTYQPMTVHADTYFALSGGALSYTTSDVALKAQRWYMEIRDKETGELVPPSAFNNVNEAKSIRIFAEGEDDATSIHPVVKNESEQKSSIYNLNGQRIAAPMKGINIINGKKILVK